MEYYVEKKVNSSLRISSVGQSMPGYDFGLSKNDPIPPPMPRYNFGHLGNAPVPQLIPGIGGRLQRSASTLQSVPGFGFNLRRNAPVPQPMLGCGIGPPGLNNPVPQPFAGHGFGLLRAFDPKIMDYCQPPGILDVPRTAPQSQAKNGKAQTDLAVRLNMEESKVEEYIEKVESFLKMESFDFIGNFGEGDEFYEVLKKTRDLNRAIEIHGLDVFEEIEDFVPFFDEKLAKKLTDHSDLMNQSPDYQKSLNARRKLPAFQAKDEILRAMESSQVLVISGETGCGKTTQIPQLILDDMLKYEQGDICKVVCTQPRRISAISIAQRVAQERNEMCGYGSSVGYQVHLDSNLPRERGSILYCTTGIILQWMKSDSLLTQVSHLVLDEIHERDIFSDFVITILKRFILPLRRDLKVILMSATLNPELFCKYFDNCPVVNIQGTTYPVMTYYLEEVLEDFGMRLYSKSKKVEHQWKEDQEVQNVIMPFVRQLDESDDFSKETIESLNLAESEDIPPGFIAQLICNIHRNYESGAILVFVKGWEDIMQIIKLLKTDFSENLGSNVRVYPLHSMIPTSEQIEVFDNPPHGVRKIVIATNIAETSITIDDVVYVVDSGKANVDAFDYKKNYETLLPEWISVSNMTQRRGRAGRVQSGLCFHLFTLGRKRLFKTSMEPEVRRKRLEGIVLFIKLLGYGDPYSFLNEMIEPPAKYVVDSAIKNLVHLNALDEEELQLTPLGYHLAMLPLDPQCGKMILLGSIFSCLDPILSVVSLLSSKRSFTTPADFKEREQFINAKMDFANGSKSDFIAYVNAMKEFEAAFKMGTDQSFCEDNFLLHSVMKSGMYQKEKLYRHLKDMGFIEKHCSSHKHLSLNRNSKNTRLVESVITSALYPNVGVRLKENSYLVSKETSRLWSQSVLSFEKSSSPWIVYYRQLKTNNRKACIYDAGEASAMTFLLFGNDLEFVKEKKIGNEVYDLIKVDNVVSIECPQMVSSIVQELRTAFMDLLRFKITNPGGSEWNPNRKEGALLNILTEILSME